MAHELLECPNCKCPLEPPQRPGVGLYCARCNAWVALDSACTGGCLTCHLVRSKETGPSCGGVQVSIAGSKQAKSGEDSGWRAWFRRFFL